MPGVCCCKTQGKALCTPALNQQPCIRHRSHAPNGSSHGFVTKPPALAFCAPNIPRATVAGAGGRTSGGRGYALESLAASAVGNKVQLQLGFQKLSMHLLFRQQ